MKVHRIGTRAVPKVFLIVATGFLLGTSDGEHQSVEGTDLPFILAGIRQNDSMLDNIEVHFIIVNLYTPEALATPIYSLCLPEEEYENVMVVSGESFRLSGDAKGVTGERKPLRTFRQLVTGNGTSIMLYLPETNQGTVFAPGSRSIHNYVTPFGFNLAMGGMCLSDYFGKTPTQLMGRDVIGDATCYVLSTESERKHGDVIVRDSVKTWVDPSIGWRARRKDVYRPGGELISTCEVVFKEWEEGVWFPVTGTSRRFNEEGTLLFTRELVVTEFKKRAVIDPKEFMMVFPEGTRVFDANLKSTYIVERK